jgi:heparosan-N-sulfate-glucuronate 5-epimerase
MKSGFLRKKVESLVSKDDYFHQFHTATAPSNFSAAYYYDLRGKLNYPGKFQGNLPLIQYSSNQFINPIHIAQFGLSHIQHYFDTGEQDFLEKATKIANELIAIGVKEDQALVWRYPLLYRGQRNWLSAMAQGQIASFFLRLAIQTNNDELFSKTRAVLEPFKVSIDKGGVQALLGSKIWFEEYAVNPPPYTLNGFIVALLGLYDAKSHIDDPTLSHLCDEAMETLSSVLILFDAKGWSRYYLATHNVLGLTLSNLASPFYHRFHLELLKVMYALTAQKEYLTYFETWNSSLAADFTFYRAMTEKILYRLLVPTLSVKTDS